MVISAREKYAAIFGRIDSLSQHPSWTTGLSNMLEWLVWSTGNVLGLTKTAFARQVVEWADEEPVRNAGVDAKKAHVEARMKNALSGSDGVSRDSKPTATLATPREALRRAKYFSEDYLNKEFDIFWSLTSDNYLNAYYAQFTKLSGSGSWATHGNSGLFANSTGISQMQMDNLSYCEGDGLLVANELKLGGKKNPDQVLKYALMFKLLKERGFIEPRSRFMLLFIGDKKESVRDWLKVIEAEIAYCGSSSKSTSKAASASDVIEIARRAEYAETTWGELMTFNRRYLSTLDATKQQVEKKLLAGFNETLASKNFLKGC